MICPDISGRPMCSNNVCSKSMKLTSMMLLQTALLELIGAENVNQTLKHGSRMFDIAVDVPVPNT